MQNKVSIILPIYNVDKYLAQCIDSILCQTYKNFEIILVDDGSPDKCGEICDTYAKKDSRIIVIHKPNGGVSSARNAGLDIMSGNSVLFIDPDDYIHREMVETLVNLMADYSADISLCFSRGTYVRDYAEPDAESYEIKTLTGKEALEKIYDGTSFEFFGYNPTAVMFRLYNADLFSDGLRFDESARMAEDLIINPYLYSRAEKVVSINRRMYYFYHAENSLTRSKMTEEKQIMLNKTVIHMYDDRINYFKGKDGYNSLVNLTYVTALFDIISKIEVTKNSDSKKELKKFYNRKYKEAVKEKRISTKQMIILGLFKISPLFFKLVSKIK
ncbi:MAG: glycosyltransferase [Clostridia bacterium]|nr:glycosyltransferase [Clostridia bacterium]